jgi:hypothetical protein
MRRFLLAVVLLLIASGCDARLNVITDFTSDHSGLLTLQAGGDQDLVSAGLLNNLPETLQASGFDVQPWSEGDISGYEGSLRFSSLDQLNRTLADVAISGGVFDAFEVSVTGSELEFNAQMPAIEEIPGGSETIQVIMRMPGTVVSDNADSRSDGGLVWIAHAGDPPRTLMARSKGSSGSTGGGAAFAGVAVVLLLAGGWLLWHRRTEPSRSSETTFTYCTGCGTRLVAGARFCSSCGKVVQPGTG